MVEDVDGSFYFCVEYEWSHLILILFLPQCQVPVFVVQYFQCVNSFFLKYLCHLAFLIDFYLNPEAFSQPTAMAFEKFHEDNSSSGNSFTSLTGSQLMVTTHWWKNSEVCSPKLFRVSGSLPEQPNQSLIIFCVSYLTSHSPPARPLWKYFPKEQPPPKTLCQHVLRLMQGAEGHNHQFDLVEQLLKTRICYYFC